MNSLAKDWAIEIPEVAIVKCSNTIAIVQRKILTDVFNS